MTKVVCFNVKYSPNVGDGLIAECLEHALKGGNRNVNVQTLDLAGRTRYGQRTVPARAIALTLLDAMPSAIRSRIVRAKLERKLNSLAPSWMDALSDAKLAIIGGGNLFQDADLNFPLKVAAALECCRASGVPVAIHGVGVVADWSEAARHLFGSIRKNTVTSISVRDKASRHAWLNQIGRSVGPVEIVRDPGLLAASLMDEDPRAADGTTVGICITHPSVLRHHAAGGTIVAGSRAFYAHLVRGCVERGWNVALFSNGAEEDQRHLNAILSSGYVRELVRLGRVTSRSRPQTPRDLLAIIAGVDAIVAHRLHACIAAFALGRPHVGLDWDAKVSGFFESVDRSSFMMQGRTATPGKIVNCIELALREGLSPFLRQQIAKEARRDIDRILERGLNAGRKPKASPGIQSDSISNSAGSTLVMAKGATT